MRSCTACGGSGHYDHNGSPPCGACYGTGEEPDIEPPDDTACRLCREPQRFAVWDLAGERWLPGYCDAHGEAMLRPLTTPVQGTDSAPGKDDPQKRSDGT